MTSRRATPPERPSSNRPRPAAPGGSTGARRRMRRGGSDGGATPVRDVPATARPGARSQASPFPGAPDELSSTARSAPRAARTRAQRPHVPLAFGYGIVSALITFLVLLVPVFVAWTIDAQSSASWNDTLGVTIDLWALAHRAHVHVDGTSVVFSPLVLTFLCVLAARYGARAAFPDVRLHARDLRAILLAFIGGYVVAAEVLGVLAALGESRVSWWSLIVGPALVAGLGAAWTAWNERDASPELAALDEVVIEATPMLLRRSLPSALRGFAALLLAMLLLLVVLLAWHGSRMWTIHGQLDPGPVGGVLLVLGQLLAAPNLVVGFAGWATGASFEAGAVSIGHSTMTPGTLPMIPVLGALPDDVGSWTWAVVALPLAAGAFIGWDAVGRLTKLSSLRAKLIVALSASGVAVIASWLLMWFSSASVADRLLGYVGPHWSAWLLMPVELCLPALTAAAVRHWMLNHKK